MRNEFKITLGLLLIVLSTFLYACGGGVSDERTANPVGLFAGPTHCQWEI